MDREEERERERENKREKTGQEERKEWSRWNGYANDILGHFKPKSLSRLLLKCVVLEQD